MRKMRNLRCFFLPLLIMGAGMYVTACSSDDNEEAKEEEVIIDNDPPKVYDGLSVSLQLLNKDSIAAKSFKQGENIVFRLVVTNNRDSTISLPLFSEMIDENFLMIYKSTGEMYGKPRCSLNQWGPSRARLVPQACLTIEVPLLEGTAKPESLFGEWGNNSPLPVGSYNVQFDIRIFKDSDKTITCRKDFVVK